MAAHVDLYFRKPIPIGQLQPSGEREDASITGTVTLIWPYSSSNRSFSFVLADSDFRLRRHKGQIRIEFVGVSAKRVARLGIGSGDQLRLSLAGAQWLDDEYTASTPGRGVGFKLQFGERVVLQVERKSGVSDILDVDHLTPSPEPVQSPTPPQSPELSGPFTTPLARYKGPTATQVWSSPVFLKRDRPLSLTFPVTGYDPFQAEEEFLDESPRKRIKFGRENSQWRFVENSQSPERDIHIEPNQIPQANPPSPVSETDEVLHSVSPSLLTDAVQEPVVEEARELGPFTSGPAVEPNVGSCDQQILPQESSRTPAIMEIPDPYKETIIEDISHELREHRGSETPDGPRDNMDGIAHQKSPLRVDLISSNAEELPSGETLQGKESSPRSRPTSMLQVGGLSIELLSSNLGSVPSSPIEGTIISNMPTPSNLLPLASPRSPLISPLLDIKGRASPYLDPRHPSSPSIDGESRYGDTIEGVVATQSQEIIADFGLDGSVFSSARPSSNRSFQEHQSPGRDGTQISIDVAPIVENHETVEAVATHATSPRFIADRIHEGDTHVVPLPVAPVIGGGHVDNIVELDTSVSLATTRPIIERLETQVDDGVESIPDVLKLSSSLEDPTNPSNSKAKHDKVVDETAEHSSEGGQELYESASEGRMLGIEQVAIISTGPRSDGKGTDVAQEEEETSKAEATLPVKSENRSFGDKRGRDTVKVEIEPSSDLNELKEILNSTEGEDDEFVVSSPPVKAKVQIVDLESETEDEENASTPRAAREVNSTQPEESVDWTIDSTSEVQQLAREINAALARQSRKREQENPMHEHVGVNELARLTGTDDGEQRSVILQDLFPDQTKQYMRDEELERQRSDISKHSQIKEDTPSPHSQELQYSIPTFMLQPSSIDPPSSHQLITPNATQDSAIAPEMFSTSIRTIQDSHDLPTPHLTQDHSAGLRSPISPVLPQRPSLVERLAERRRSLLRAGRGSSPIPESISPWFTNRNSSPNPDPNGGDGGMEHPNEDVATSPISNEDNSSDNDLPPVTDLLSGLYSSQQSQASQRTASQTPRPQTQRRPSLPAIGLRTSLSYFAPLSNLLDHYTSIISVLALAISSTSISRAKSGPRDFHTTLYITDRSIASSAFPLISVQIFRPKKDAFPILSSGDMVLLRNFKVVSRDRRMGLLSTDTSAWAVFWKEYDEVQVRGPPVEWDQEESTAVECMREWWRSFDKAKKRRIDAAVPKEKVKCEPRDGTTFQKNDTNVSSDGPNADQDKLQDASQNVESLIERPKSVRRQSTALMSIDSVDVDRNGFHETRGGTRYTDEPEENPTRSQQSGKKSTRAKGLRSAKTGVHELRNVLRYTDEPEERLQSSQNSRKCSTRSQSMKQESREMSKLLRGSHHIDEPEDLSNTSQHIKSTSPTKGKFKREKSATHKLRDGTRYTDEPEERPQSSLSSYKQSTRSQSIIQDSQGVHASRDGTRYTKGPEDQLHSSQRLKHASARKPRVKSERRF